VAARRRIGAAALSALAALTLAVPAAAYCRTTTCDPLSDLPEERCEDEDGDGCFDTGAYLHWAQRCISFSVQKNGSPASDISYEEAHDAISGAFEIWLNSECGDGPPSLEAHPTEPVRCWKAEYNLDGPNANVWMFRDDRWPYQDEEFGSADTLALTTVTFDPTSGEIYDADVEINAHDNRITVGDDRVVNDLASIVTHEAGHVLGLSHSDIPSGTMYYAYLPTRTNLRSLHDDDLEGICAAYPVDRDTPDECDPEPRRGFTPECATTKKGWTCSAPGSGSSWRASSLGLLAVAALAARLRRRQRRGQR
jgi:hypothetical protein